MPESEVARLKQEIEVTYLAGKMGLMGLTSGIAKHAFIEQRTERLGTLHHELQKLVGEQAIIMLADTIASLPEQVTRYEVLRVLHHELSPNQETSYLTHRITEAWETLDLLIKQFGEEIAHKIIHAPDRYSKGVNNG